MKISCFFWTPKKKSSHIFLLEKRNFAFFKNKKRANRELKAPIREIFPKLRIFYEYAALKIL